MSAPSLAALAYHRAVPAKGGGSAMGLAEDATLEEVRRFFEADRFATERCGCRIVEAARGHAVCELPLTPSHANATGGIMGGAIFTLADFALAVASNVGEPLTVSVQSSIEYLKGTRGSRLTATCDADRSGRSLGFYTVDVTDDLGVHVARMTATCYRRA